MRKAVGVLMIILLLGSMVTAAGNTAYATSIEAQNDPYEKFWEILNREAELVVQLNTTGNVSLAQELIQNSRLGAENAANISALIWQALEELKASGVKTYYTAEELRIMAQNISQNGLPQETVESLKAQGWTDEQIQALEGYIVKNADEINEDFNMTAFLENFSMAFIDVAFKYSHYEAWALEKWKWARPVEAPTGNKGEIINPALSGDWVILYLRYSQKDYQGMDPAAETLKESMYRLITGARGSVTLLSYERTTYLSQLPGIVDSVKWSENGGLLFTVTARRMTTSEVITEKKTYYWPNALRAYELISNVIALVKARNYGNNNAKIDSILNQKVAELKDALKVIEVSSEVTRTPITSPIKPIPIKPGDPKLPDPLPNLPLKSTSGTATTSSITGGAGEVTVNGVPVDQSVLVEALDTQNDPGTLVITDVAVVVDKNVPGSVEYHVEVSFKAEDNAVNNIRIKVKDYTARDSDSGTVSFLNAGESYTWKSSRFTYTRSSGGELAISGEVEITYTPSCGAVPLSQESPEASSISPSCEERTVTKDYSATVDLTSPVDWSKVNVRVEASRTSITEGESVTYRVIVENNQNVELDGVEYSVTIPFSPTNSRTYSEVMNVNWTGEQVIFSKTVTYNDAGTYVVHASIYWNGNSKSAETSVTVTLGTLSITGVDVSPVNPTHGDSVSFDVSIKNPVSRSRSVTVKLFIDGQEKSSKSLTIGGGSTGSVALTWTAQAGEHEYRIEVWESGKLEASRSGSIEVNFSAGSGVLKIKEVQVIPSPPTVKKPTTFRIKVKNLYSISKEAKISLEIPEIGFKTDLTKVIAPGDYGIFDIQWKPGEVGLIDVITKVFSREDNGGEKLEDEEHETVEVRDNLFGRLVPNVNNTVVQGTMVHFDVIVENKDDYPAYNVPIRVLYTYQDPNGEFSNPIRVFERNPHRIDGLGVNLTWFNMTLTNLGKYYFTLYVNGEIEDEKIITVNSEGNVMAWMECDPEFVSKEEDSVTCNVNVKNQDSASVNVWITDVYFAGGKIYDSIEGDNLVVPDPRSLALDPGSSGTFTFTIPINNELQRRVPVDLGDINPGTPIAIKTYLNQLKEPIIYMVEMNPRDLGDFSLPEKEIAVGIGSGIAGALTYFATNEEATLAGALTAAGTEALSAYVSLGSIIGFWIYLAYEGTKPIPPSDPADNNLIVGDES